MNSEQNDIACARCGYNLNGLAEPRCPECGHAFTWDDLLRAKQEQHPWLFEDDGGWRLARFLETCVRSIFPASFWSCVPPSRPVQTKRLRRYWLLTLIAPLLATAVPPVSAGITMAREIATFRARYVPVQGRPGLLHGPVVPHLMVDVSGNTLPATWWSPQPTSPSQRQLEDYAQAELDRVAPPPISFAFVRMWWADRVYAGSVNAIAIITYTAAWPWLTAASLLVLQRRATINHRQVLRVCTYACDFSLLATVVILSAPANAPFVLLFAAVPLTIYRLSAGVSDHLQFERPILITLASQLTIATLVATFLSSSNYYP